MVYCTVSHRIKIIVNKLFSNERAFIEPMKKNFHLQRVFSPADQGIGGFLLTRTRGPAGIMDQWLQGWSLQQGKNPNRNSSFSPLLPATID
jgi:hypothetical protein